VVVPVLLLVVPQLPPTVPPLLQDKLQLPLVAPPLLQDKCLLLVQPLPQEWLLPLPHVPLLPPVPPQPLLLALLPLHVPALKH
jgi:hypothetical protein